MPTEQPHLLMVPAFLGAHGGLENHVLATARVATLEGYRVTVVTPRPIPVDGELGPRLREWAEVDDAERHWRATPAGRFWTGAATAKAVAGDRRWPTGDRRATLAGDRARAYLDRFWSGPGLARIRGADVVHTFGKPKPFVTAAIRSAHGAGVPTVYAEIAEVTHAYARRPDLRGFADVAEKCDRVVAISESQGDDVRRRFGYDGPITVIEQWADEIEDDLLAIDRPSRPDDTSADSNPVVIGSLCRLSPEKGLDTVLRAFATVVAAHPIARLVVAGAGDLDRPLQSLADDLGLGDHVRFVGFVPDRTAFYRDLDVFVVASIEEGGPITGAEAMAAGLPVVTSGCGAMPDRVRDGREGLRFDAGDEDALAAALGRLVEDGSLRADLGAAARARYRERNAQQVNHERLADLWRSLRTSPAGATR